MPLRAIPFLNVDGDDHMLLHFLYYFTTSIFGFNEWAVRIPDLTAGLLLLVLIGRFAHAIFDDVHF